MVLATNAGRQIASVTKFYFAAAPQRTADVQPLSSRLLSDRHDFGNGHPDQVPCVCTDALVGSSRRMASCEARELVPAPRLVAAVQPGFFASERSARPVELRANSPAHSARQVEHERSRPSNQDLSSPIPMTRACAPVHTCVGNSRCNNSLPSFHAG